MTPAELKAARDALGLSQPQLASALGLHPMTVSKYERGVIEVPQAVAMAVELLSLLKSA